MPFPSSCFVVRISLQKMTTIKKTKRGIITIHERGKKTEHMRSRLIIHESEPSTSCRIEFRTIKVEVNKTISLATSHDSI